MKKNSGFEIDKMEENIIFLGNCILKTKNAELKIAMEHYGSRTIANIIIFFK